jgi:hypothetical protein
VAPATSEALADVIFVFSDSKNPENDEFLLFLNKFLLIPKEKTSIIAVLWAPGTLEVVADVIFVFSNPTNPANDYLQGFAYFVRL